MSGEPVQSEERIQERKENRRIPPVSKEWTHILLLGCDSLRTGEYDNSDSMIILSLNRRKRSVCLTSVMRDIWVLIPGFGEQKINAAVRYGGPELAMRTVSAYFELSIGKYIMVNMTAMAHIIDLLGGIDMEITEDELEAINFWAEDLQRNTGSDDVITPVDRAGFVHLCGAQVVGHARNRWIGADYARTERQRQVLIAIARKIRTKPDLKTLFQLIHACRKYAKTNLRLIDLAQFVPFALHFDTEAVSCFRIPAENTFINVYDNKISCLRVDFIKNTQLLHEFLNVPDDSDTKNAPRCNTAGSVSQKNVK